MRRIGGRGIEHVINDGLWADEKITMNVTIINFFLSISIVKVLSDGTHNRVTSDSRLRVKKVIRTTL